MELESQLGSFTNLTNFQVQDTICKSSVDRGVYNFVKDFFSSNISSTIAYKMF